MLVLDAAFTGMVGSHAVSPVTLPLPFFVPVFLNVNALFDGVFSCPENCSQ